MYPASLRTYQRRRSDLCHRFRRLPTVSVRASANRRQASPARQSRWSKALEAGNDGCERDRRRRIWAGSVPTGDLGGNRAAWCCEKSRPDRRLPNVREGVLTVHRIEVPSRRSQRCVPSREQLPFARHAASGCAPSISTISSGSPRTGSPGPCPTTSAASTSTSTAARRTEPPATRHCHASPHPRGSRPATRERPVSPCGSARYYRVRRDLDAARWWQRVRASQVW